MVSIIIINYNTFGLTCNCINSVIEHTKGCTYEIILVDNASTEKQSSSFKEIFGERITFLQSPKNLGFAGGNNFGIEHAKGDFILLLNSDTELLEDSISKTLDFAKDIDKLGAVTCKLLNDDRQSLQNAARPFFSFKKHFLKSTGLKSIFRSSYSKVDIEYNMNTSFASDWIWGTFFLFPKKNLQYSGGRLSETFFMYSEDVEWCYIFHINGLQNYYFAGTGIIHYGGKSSSDNSSRKKKIRDSHLLFVKKYHGNLVSVGERFLFFLDDMQLLFRRYKKKIKRRLNA